MKFSRLFLLLFISFLNTFGSVRPEQRSVKVIELNSSTREVLLVENAFEVFEDKRGAYTIRDITDSSFSGFVTNQQSYRYAENPGSVYWIKATIKNTDQGAKWVLEVLSHHTQDLRVYIPDGGEYREYISGQKYNFDQRPYLVKNPVFNLPSDQKQYTIFLSVQSNNEASFEYKIKSQEEFTRYATKEYWYLGGYYGILSFIIIYFFLLFAITRERTYFYFGLYIISCAVASFLEDGLGYEFLWPATPFINLILGHYIAYIFFLVSFTLYATSFLEMRFRIRKYFYAVWGVTLLYIALYYSDTLPDILNSFLFLVPFVLIYAIAIRLFKEGYKASRYFIAGQTLLLIAILLNRLSWYGFIDSGILTVYSFNFSVMLEGFIFSYAFADKFNLLKKEKEKAQENLIHQLKENEELQTKVNRELEQKVAARTKELEEKSLMLEESNRKLAEITEQVNKMNSRLDYDNWQLNKKVTEETKARILNDEVSFEEFQKIFPTDFACLKYLEELKWNEGYECRKCANNKFIALQKMLSRRCTKCGYIESATADTIFHSTKFPLTKAFYLVYYCSQKNQNYSLSELSEMLDLRKNTCWSFHKRIKEKDQAVVSGSSKSTSDKKFHQLILEQKV